VRTWLPTLVAIVASFILAWADTYFLAARLGVAGAGDYEALYRILGICTYLFMPWASVLTSRVSVHEPRPMVRPMVLSVTTTALALAAVTGFCWWLAPQWFPNLDLPLEALPGLLVFYLLMPVSFLLGLALYVRAGTLAVAKATGIAAVLCIAGQAVFTLRGGPAEAAAVQAFALGVAVLLQLRVYLQTTRQPSTTDLTAP
jgi:O-antigen/teichoic acid export membrane protein